MLEANGSRTWATLAAIVDALDVEELWKQQSRM
jgi:hypothetical protein